MGAISEILLRRRNKLNLQLVDSIDDQGSTTTKRMLASIAKNIESYGYAFSKEVFEVLLNYSREDLEAFYKELIPITKAMVGADKEYRPMYPNFPEQVMEASDAELFINAIIHYYSYGEWSPVYPKNERMPLIDDNKAVVLSLGTTEDIMEIFSNLMSSKTSLSEQDKSDIEKIVSEYPNYHEYMPDEIPLKENAALIGKIIIKNAPVKKAEYIAKYFKTSTDVLRLITALSDGDISLADKTKYVSLKRCERRIIMDLLADCGNILEDMYRYQYEWIRVGEVIHPFEFKQNRYTRVRESFDVLRNKKKPLFLPGKIQAAINRRDIFEATRLLKERPGDYARNLDKLLRECSNKAETDLVIGCFAQVANKVSTPVLLQVRQHFKGRNKANPVRVFFPKGNLARAISIPNTLSSIDELTCKQIVEICTNALHEIYRERESLGKVYIDPEFKNYLVPFSQRSASSTTKSMVRGSRFSIRPDAQAVRAFIWWTNKEVDPDSYYDNSRVDIDLSAAIYDENWHFIEHISYTRLRSEVMKAYHSGDITNGGDVNGAGVAEFLDVDVNSVAKKGRYIVYQVQSFAGHPYADLPNCRFGWMEREDVCSGEIFEPNTVEMSMDVSANSVVAIPVIFDCQERQFIWCDMNLSIPVTQSHRGGINIESNLDRTTATCYAMTHLNKPNLYTLIALNARARGKWVWDRNEADIVFSNDLTMPVYKQPVYDEDGDLSGFEMVEKTGVPIIRSFDMDYFMQMI